MPHAPQASGRWLLVGLCFPRRAGPRHADLAMGLLAAGHALGSWLGGLLYDRYADYDWLWITAFVSAGGAGLAVFLLRETRGRTPVAQPA